MMVSTRFPNGRHGRWFFCRNGHPYCVDACGRPTMVRACADCGVLTGGLGHHQIRYIGDFDLGVYDRSNRRIDRDFRTPGTPPAGEYTMDRDVDPLLQGNENYFLSSTPQDKSLPKYCLQPAESRRLTLGEVSEGMRGVSGRACCMQRLLVHAALTAGAAFGGEEWTTAALDFATSIPDMDGPRLRALFTDRFAHDWQRLKVVLGALGDDDTELLVHAALSGLEADVMVPWPGRSIPSAVGNSLPTRQIRREWEQAVDKSIVSGLLAADVMAGKLEQLKAAFDDENERAVAVMLQERALSHYDASERARAAPALFRYRQAFSLDSLMFQAFPVREEHKLLHKFIAEQDDVRAAHGFADSLEWLRLLTTKYDRRISCDAAKALTVADVLRDLDAQQGQWHRAWNGFEATWRLGRHLDQDVPGEACLHTPAGIGMGPSQSLVYCLPTKKNEGLVAYAMARILAGEHNKLRELAQDHLKARAGGQLDALAEPTEVSPSAFTRAHAVHSKRGSFDAAFAAFVDFVKRQCLRYDMATGKLEYDLAAAERWLVDEYFAHCPTIKLERFQLRIDIVHFLGASAMSDAMDTLSAAVPQVPLPLDTAGELRSKVANRIVAQAWLEQLEQSLVIMVDSIVEAEVTGESLLWSVLMVDSNLFDKVRLQHVADLYKFLRTQLSDEEFPTVDAQYKVKLTDTFIHDYKEYPAADVVAVELLKEQAAAVDDSAMETILSSFTFLLDKHLHGVTIAPTLSIFECIMGDCDDEIEDAAVEFEALFPMEGEGQLSMAHFCEVFKLLDTIHNISPSD